MPDPETTGDRRGEGDAASLEIAAGGGGRKKKSRYDVTTARRDSSE